MDDDRIEYACAACGTLNRIPRARLKDDPKCGKCKSSVFPEKPVAVTDATWKREVEDSPIPVLVDFWAPWCGPCRVIAPTLEELAEERGEDLRVVKLNVDENQMTSAQYDVMSIQTLIVFRNGEIAKKIIGALPKKRLVEELEPAIAV